MVLAKAGRRSKATATLPKRFEMAIDAAAMKGHLGSSDDYLIQWRDGKGMACGDDLQAAADAKAQDIDTAYSPERLRKLIANAGREF